MKKRTFLTKKIGKSYMTTVNLGKSIEYLKIEETLFKSMIYVKGYFYIFFLYPVRYYTSTK